MANISEDEYRRRWLSPHAAKEVLKRHGFDPGTVREAILSRVSAGGLQSAAETIEMTAPGVSPYAGSFELLHSKIWAISSLRSVFWESGDATFVKRHKPGGPDFTYVCTGIRFDPSGIANMAAQKAMPDNPLAERTQYDSSSDAVLGSLETLRQTLGRAALSPEPNLEDAAPKTEPREKAPVSPATLRAWWDMCKTIRPAEAWTGDQMREFFDQCLPDKHASRDQLRGVRGKQPPGPKAIVAE
jgi:hypothetical protein